MTRVRLLLSIVNLALVPAGALFLGASTADAVTVPTPGPTQIGEVASPTSGLACSAASGPETQSGSSGPSYTMPSAGVITSFSHQANSTTGGTVRLLVFRDSTQSPGSFDLVGKSDIETVTPSTLNTFDTRVPVQAGDYLGIDNSAQTACLFDTGDNADILTYNVSGYDSTAGGTFTPDGTDPGERWNISAQLEPDADSDGYGDITQDLCPTDANTQGACPVVVTPTPTATPVVAPAGKTAPDTTLTKAPKKTMHKRQAVFKFTSTDSAGDTFQCSIDSGAFKPCRSAVVEKFGRGKHAFQVRAIDSAGNVDQTPATVTWKFVPKHRG